MRIILFLLGCLVLTNCQTYNRTDYCLNYDLKFDLANPSLLFGDWYPIVVDSNLSFNYDCHKFNIFEPGTGIINVNVISMLNNNSVNNWSLDKTKRNNSFLSWINNTRALNTIVDTDFNTYCVAIKCMEYADGFRYHVFILSRTMTLPDDLILKLENSITQNFGTFDFRRINFSNCS
jgi:hypothetical protein